MTKKEMEEVIDSQEKWIEELMEEYRKLSLKFTLHKMAIFDAEIKKSWESYLGKGLFSRLWGKSFGGE